MEDKHKEPTTELVNLLIHTFIQFEHAGKPVPEKIQDTYRYWVDLFSRYNEANAEKNGHSIRMGCKPCYMRVYLWEKRQSSEWMLESMDRLEAKAREQLKQHTKKPD